MFCHVLSYLHMMGRTFFLNAVYRLSSMQTKHHKLTQPRHQQVATGQTNCICTGLQDIWLVCIFSPKSMVSFGTLNSMLVSNLQALNSKRETIKILHPPFSKTGKQKVKFRFSLLSRSTRETMCKPFKRVA